MESDRQLQTKMAELICRIKKKKDSHPALLTRKHRGLKLLHEVSPRVGNGIEPDWLLI